MNRRDHAVWCSAAPLLLLLVVCGCANAAGDAGDATDAAERYVDGGDPARGKTAMRTYGCGSCHMIPGVDGARGMVGPPLLHWAKRTMIAGEVPNDPARLITWLTVPQSIEPGTGMPNMGVTDGEARDMAAYLYTLR